MADSPDVEHASWELARRIVQQFRASGDRRVHWTLGELGYAAVAFEGSKRLAASNDTLGHLLYFRLLAEIAIRLSWAARSAHDSQQTDRHIDGLMKRDLLNLQKAAQKTSGRTNPDAAAFLSELQAAKPATPKLEELAHEGDAEGQYRYYRLAASMVHAGAGIRMLAQFPPDATQINAREAIIVCIAEATALLTSLGMTGLPDDEVDRLVADGVFEISPTVWTVRLRRSLARSKGSRGVRAAVTSVSIRQMGESLTVSAQASVAGESRRQVISASGSEYESVFSELLAKAATIR